MQYICIAKTGLPIQNCLRHISGFHATHLLQIKLKKAEIRVAGFTPVIINKLSIVCHFFADLLFLHLSHGAASAQVACAFAGGDKEAKFGFAVIIQLPGFAIPATGGKIEASIFYYQGHRSKTGLITFAGGELNCLSLF